MSYDKIPAEMKMYKQFVLWRFEDKEGAKPTKVPYSANNGGFGKVDDPSTWATFDQCVHSLKSNNLHDGLGFVLTEDDPFAFIDLDDAKDQVTMDRQLTIYQEFDSYAECSPGGNGLHIIIRGKLTSGRKRGSIEIYSKLRYMTMTGDVFRDAPVNEHNEKLNILYDRMTGGNKAATVYMGIEKATETDEEIIEHAKKAVNGDKFINLYEGRWQNYYQSQSEADLALVDIIAFYSQNKAQIQRIFRASELGKRDKAFVKVSDALPSIMSAS